MLVDKERNQATGKRTSGIHVSTIRIAAVVGPCWAGSLDETDEGKAKLNHLKSRCCFSSTFVDLRHRLEAALTRLLRRDTAHLQIDGNEVAPTDEEEDVAHVGQQIVFGDIHDGDLMLVISWGLKRVGAEKRRKK